MASEVITAVLGSAALAYALGRLIRSHLRENRRERELVERAAALDMRDIHTSRFPDKLNEFQEGYLAGLDSRRDVVKEQTREQRAPAHSG